ncbi:hypothetical protein LEMLEM_LOCUS9270, partial [Lemmus lemmus]
MLEGAVEEAMTVDLGMSDGGHGGSLCGAARLALGESEEKSQR